MKFDTLNDKCRYYQSLTDYRLTPNSFVVVHCDGRSFSKMIKHKFNKPFDDDFIDMMNKTAIFLCENVACCKMAYVQSDEISLILSDLDYGFNGEYMFGGRLCKLQSIIASLATSKFNQLMTVYNIKKYAERQDEMYLTEELINEINRIKPIQFDCKVWNVPNMNDAFAWLLFRQIDCIKNSKQQTAQTYLSHKELHGLNTDKQIELLKNKTNIDWENNFDDGKKYGRFVVRTIQNYETIVNGETITYRRGIWMPSYAYLLTEDDNANKIKDIIAPRQDTV